MTNEREWAFTEERLEGTALSLSLFLRRNMSRDEVRAEDVIDNIPIMMAGSRV